MTQQITIQTAWPADPKKLGDRFGIVTPLRKKLGLGPHRGIDFALPNGTPLKAAGNGRVVLNEWSDGLGHQLEIRIAALDDKGKRVYIVVAYDHLKEAPKLKVGDLVKVGQIVAHSGNTGSYTSGPHLHFMAGKKPGLAKNTTFDPIPYIERTLQPTTIEIEDDK